MKSVGSVGSVGRVGRWGDLTRVSKADPEKLLDKFPDFHFAKRKR
ncbi:hypothetical protein [Moorena sp. SIO1F2]|nr:hypothetical protein [Moorena sp. SIO1F2]